MRLTTLARKVAITPTKLIDFLEEKGVELTKGINTKLDDLSVTMVKEAFLPDEIEDDLPVIEENQSETEAEIKTEPEFSPKMNTDENPIKEKIIVEIHLNHWIEKGDSKISMTYFLKIPFELLRIYRRYH